MTLNPENLSRPEAFAEERFRKRYRASLRKHGACAFCVHRDATFGVLHCAGNPERQRGACTIDQRQPKFKTDDEAIRGIRDAA
jgi:hypothetical protein